MQQNYPNYAYIVETLNADMEHLSFFTIEQFIQEVGSSQHVRYNENSVQATLHDFHKRTGANYRVVWSGPHTSLKTRIRQLRLEMF